MSNKTVMLGVRIRPETKEALENAAFDDERSVASLTEKLLGEALRARGYLGERKRGQDDEPVRRKPGKKD